MRDPAPIPEPTLPLDRRISSLLSSDASAMLEIEAWLVARDMLETLMHKAMTPALLTELERDFARAKDLHEKGQEAYVEASVLLYGKTAFMIHLSEHTEDGNVAKGHYLLELKAPLSKEHLVHWCRYSLDGIEEEEEAPVWASETGGNSFGMAWTWFRGP